MLKKQEEKIATILVPGMKVKHRRTGEVGVISEIKNDKCFVNYSSYTCARKIYSVRYRWARKIDLMEVDNEN